MAISRRTALLATATSIGLSRVAFPGIGGTGFSSSAAQPVFSIRPVVSDNVWIWDQQPEDQKGVVDSREFEVSIGVRWKTEGTTRNLASSTVAPVAFPEQEILDLRIEKSEGCEAAIVPLSDTAAQLQVGAGLMERGQVIEAKAVYRLKIARVCPHYDAEQFPTEQSVPRQVRKRYLGNSPGIRSDLTCVKKVVDQVRSRHEHPWETAKKFHAWVWENIQGVPGDYTSVRAAIEDGVGDCEERAGVFIALCRAAGIPARLVWVPNHSWAEFCLFDENGIAHWIAAHTAAYSWFGWTGAHELVLQKGDRIPQQGKGSIVRLVTDWYSFEGRRPTIEFLGEMKPVAAAGKDPGPGKRQKNSHGGWDLKGDHPHNRRIRS